MNPADILAAARSQSGAGGEAGKAKKSVAAAGGRKPGEMSAADILAAARGSKDAADAKPKPKPATAKAKPATKSAPAKGASAPRDTSSVLASARKPVKPGPMSKAEAAAKGKDVPTGGKRQAPPMPEKPAYAKPMPKSKAGGVDDRRGFLAGIGSAIFGSFLAVGFFSLAAVGLIWTLGTARFMFPNVLIEPPKRFKVGSPADFAPGTVTTKFKAQYGVWIVNTEYEGQAMITAIKSVCTHLGCTPNWLEGEQKFKCPCHGSGFYKDGINFEGPAPRPLERYTIQRSDDGQLEIDKSRIYQQEMGQWNEKSSFFAV
jgi:cytochrome b6-f complex iron-sulfur subunit